MTVQRRKTSKGMTSEFHYRFTYNKKKYSGVCEGCTTQRAAQKFENNIKEQLSKLAEQKSVEALVVNFKQELTGGVAITLENAFELYLAKPRKKVPSEKQQGINQSQWNDFCEFIKSRYPETEQLDKVNRQQAEEYIKYLRDNGRFTGKVQYSRKYKENETEVNHSYKTLKKLSPRTINAFHKTLKSVFSKLKEDAGILYNPFDFEMLTNNSESRDAFTLDELKLIGDNLNDFVEPLIIIGTFTGLSEGDICLLTWEDISDKWITRKRRKTGTPLQIPILPRVKEFLEKQRLVSGNGTYVLPEHAEMYQKNPSGISYRFKSFLENIGIKTTKQVKGRGRSVSVKDVHSLRHTFAYMAGCYQIPLPIVQAVLGHMSSEMTKHYQAHANKHDTETQFSKMPDFLIESKTTTTTEPEREQLIELAKTGTLAQVKNALACFK